jgi:hypothetical protein
LGTAYTLLVAAFGWGVLKSADGKRSLRIVGILLIINALVGLAWSPMHQREVLAAGGGTFTDTWHIVMSVITLLFMFVLISIGAFSFGKRFRVFSFVTILIFLVFGILVGIEAPNVQKNLPTPFIGLWERINIAAFMVWLLVFAFIMIKAEKKLSIPTSSKHVTAGTQIFTKQDSQIKETVQ